MTNNTDHLKGWIYFIRSGDAIKIGFSIAPKQRIQTLQTSHHIELELLAWVPTSTLTERQAHEQFDHLRIRGEWFRAEPDLMEFIGTLEQPAPVKPPARKVEILVAPSRLPVRSPEPATKRYMTQEIRDLIVQRNLYGAETPKGHACSNLIEQATNMADYVRPAWATDERQTLPWLMKRQMARLSN